MPLSKSPQNLPLTTVVYAFVFSKMLWSSLELNGHFKSDRKIYHAKKLCNFSKTVFFFWGGGGRIVTYLLYFQSLFIFANSQSYYLALFTIQRLSIISTFVMIPRGDARLLTSPPPSCQNSRGWGAGPFLHLWF